MQNNLEANTLRKAVGKWDAKMLIILVPKKF